MKLLRTIIIFDKGEIATSEDWRKFHSGYRDAITGIVHPEGSDILKLRKREKIGKSSYRRNGVNPLKRIFLKNMIDMGWESEGQVRIEKEDISVPLKSYPEMIDHYETIDSSFGGFDFVTQSEMSRIAIEWETGNISSSHRSLNKLCIALNSGDIHIGVLVVPSRQLYTHLTDRIGNISELSPYLSMWKIWGESVVSKGLLAVSIVEHDELTEDENVPFLTVATDGRHRQGQDRLNE